MITTTSQPDFKKRYKISLSLIFVALIFSGKAMAQKVEVHSQTSFRPTAESKAFIFWEAATDTALLTPVATLKTTGIGLEAHVETLFDRLKTKAQALGANAFRLDTLIDQEKKVILSLKVYYATESAIKQNTQNQEKNVIYVFGGLHPSDRKISFKVNNTDKDIQGGHFSRLPIKPGKEVKISKGSLAGSWMVIKAKEEEPALFMSVAGFGIGLTPTSYAGDAAIGFSTGRITALNKSFGRMLVTILKASETAQSE